MITRVRRSEAFIALALFLLLATSFTHAQDSPDARVMPDTTLRLRVAPSLDAEILAVLDPQTSLTILSLSVDADWLRVETGDGLLGWVYAEYVDLYIDLTVEFPDGSAYLRLPSAVVDHVRAIFADGQARGNRAGVFAKVGDSITVSPLTLNPIGDGLYTLADYAYLQGVIDFYRRAETRDGRNSFNHETLAAKVGWTTYRVLNPEESDPDLCLSGESPLMCEYRVLKPTVALIMFGTNDVSVLLTSNFRANLNTIVEQTEGQGIIPVLTTIPVREGYEDRVREFNGIIVEIARAHAIPVIDYGGAMLALGEDALDLDGAHPSIPPKGYAGAADFRAHNLRYGYVLRNLTALQMLDAIWQITSDAAD